ncbi:MAG: 6-phosphogluconolactonase [Gammaproteobacteria bacterium]
MSAWRVFADPASLEDVLCEAIGAAIAASITARGVALLGLSGGSTPLPLYRRLAQASLDWPRVVIALVDERWVPVDHPASNEGALRHAFAPALAQGARLQGMKNPSIRAADGLAVCEADYRSLPLPFDLVLLGMGEDGHIASLFPRAEGLDAALDADSPALCAAISAAPSRVTGEFTERVSLTLGALHPARVIVLLALGEAKRHTLIEAAAGSDVAAMPVRALLGKGNDNLNVWWAPQEHAG